MLIVMNFQLKLQLEVHTDIVDLVETGRYIPCL